VGCRSDEVHLKTGIGRHCRQHGRYGKRFIGTGIVYQRELLSNNVSPVKILFCVPFAYQQRVFLIERL
jgi:hypothetical protein